MFLMDDDLSPTVDSVEADRKLSLLVISVFVKLILALIAYTDESAFSLMVLETLLLITLIASKKVFSICLYLAV